MFEENNYDKEMARIKKRSDWQCCVKKCTDKSIYSHIISKSISIDKIAKNGHLTVFSPMRKGDVKIPRFIPAGVNDNPAFNGFCKNHDGMFELIDNSEIDSLLGVYLQIYRTISSEIYFSKMGEVLYPDIDIEKALDLISKNTIEQLDENHNEIDDEKFEGAIEIVKSNLLRVNEEKNLNLSGQVDSLEKLQEYFLNEICESKKILSNKKLDKNILQALEIDDLNYQIFIYLTDFQIPVAISTMHTLPCNEGSDSNSYSFYIVVPYENSIAIIGVVDGAAHPFILNKTIEVINSSFRESISVLNFIESLVMTSPDDSFFSPAVLEEMSSDKLRVFTEDCMCLHEFLKGSKYLSEYDMSIFDNVRELLINELSAKKENEVRKLSQVPMREDYSKRIMKMHEKISRENIILNKL